jgi:hypothetical protein
MFSHNWEDYGHTDGPEYPGSNGHLRENSVIPGTYSFGSSGGSRVAVTDYVNANPFVQATVLTSGAETITPDDCVTITLP